jgi:hypothetical protein
MTQTFLRPVNGDVVLLVDATTGNETPSLPAGFAAQRRYTIRRADASANTVVVSVPSGGSIDGVIDATASIAARGEVLFTALDANAWLSNLPSVSGTNITDGSVEYADLSAAAKAAAAAAGVAAGVGSFGQLWATPAASTTLTGTLAAWTVTAVDCTAGAGARSLPAASSVAAGTAFTAKKADTSANALVISRAGSDLIFGTGSGATTKTLTLAGEAVEFVSDGVSKWTVRASDTPSGALSATYARLTTKVTPLLRRALPDLIATSPGIAYSAANAASGITNPLARTLLGGSITVGGAQTFISKGTDAASADYVAGSSVYGNELPVWFFSFLTDAPSIEIVYQGSASPSYRLLVGGYALSQNAVVAGGSGSGAQHRLTITFGSRKWREVTVESESLFASSVVASAIDTIMPAPRPRKIAFMGDSYSQNGGVNGIAPTASRIAGCEWVLNGSGGTGYNQDTGAGGKAVFLVRLPGLLAAAPDYLVTCGGINDGTGTLAADVAAYLALAKGTLASDRIFVVGPWDPPSQNHTTSATKRDIIRTATLATGCRFIDNIAAGWQTGTGNVAAPTGDGNSDIYIPGSGETTHPVNPDGYTYLGARLGLAVAALIGA